MIYLINVSLADFGNNLNIGVLTVGGYCQSDISQIFHGDVLTASIRHSPFIPLLQCLH